MATARLPNDLLAWAACAVGPDAVVTDVGELRRDRPPWLLQVRTHEGPVRVVLKAGREVQPELRTEAAALLLASEAQLPVPRIVATDLDGNVAGTPAILMTFLDGDACVPIEADPLRLRAIGAAAAEIHKVQARPSPDLPVRHRHMPWIDFAEERRMGTFATTPLLDHADRLLAARGVPHVDPVFVHGDLWAGNMLWVGGVVVATIDWEAAGVGGYGVDLGSLRLDAALMHGEGAADEVSAGWAEASGRPPKDLPTWDIVAGLNTPTDMADLLPTLPEAGRADLDGPTLNARRDAFLHAAVSAIASPH